MLFFEKLLHQYNQKIQLSLFSKLVVFPITLQHYKKNIHCLEVCCIQKNHI